MAVYECWRSAEEIAEPGTMIEVRSARDAADLFIRTNDTFGGEEYESCVVRDKDGEVRCYDMEVGVIKVIKPASCRHVEGPLCRRTTATTETVGPSAGLSAKSITPAGTRLTRSPRRPRRMRSS